MKLIDDNFCFVCGKNNPIGLKLDFFFDGKTIQTDFTPRKELRLHHHWHIRGNIGS